MNCRIYLGGTGIAGTFGLKIRNLLKGPVNNYKRTSNAANAEGDEDEGGISNKWNLHTGTIKN